MKNAKSLGINALLNMVKTGCSIVFPIVTFPYVTRILHAENLGVVNYTNSIVSYFSLLAALGLSTYGIREGAKYKDHKEKFKQFASEIFTINLFSTLVSYVLLVFCICMVSEFKKYEILILLQSSSILFTTLGMDWINSVFEDFMYITIRTVLFQLFSMVLLFIFVTQEEDYITYAMILVFSGIGSNIMNFFYVRKYCRIKVVKCLNFKIHLVPIITIFASGIASVIYTSSDMTILGIMVDNYAVGVYSVAGKVYTVVKQLMFAVLIVSLPRFAYYFSNSKEIYIDSVNKVFQYMCIIVIPAATGLFMLSKNIVLLISGYEYLDAVLPLQIFSGSVIFASSAFFLMQTVCLPMCKESYMMQATILGAVLNIVLNLFVIPEFKQAGAAFTTMLSEIVVFLFIYIRTRTEIRIQFISKNIRDVIIASVAMAAYIAGIQAYVGGNTANLLLSILGGMVVYGCFLLFLRNEIIIKIIKDMTIGNI